MYGKQVDKTVDTLCFEDRHCMVLVLGVGLLGSRSGPFVGRASRSAADSTPPFRTPSSSASTLTAAPGFTTPPWASTGQASSPNRLTFSIAHQMRDLQAISMLRGAASMQPVMEQWHHERQAANVVLVLINKICVAAGCGLAAVYMSWSAAEYLYMLLLLNRTRLPPQALFIIRYHKVSFGDLVASACQPRRERAPEGKDLAIPDRRSKCSSWRSTTRQRTTRSCRRPTSAACLGWTSSAGSRRTSACRWRALCKGVRFASTTTA